MRRLRANHVRTSSVYSPSNHYYSRSFTTGRSPPRVTLGINPGATLLCGGRPESHNFLRDQFQCAIAGGSREDYRYRDTDCVCDPPLRLAWQRTAPRPRTALKQWRRDTAYSSGHDDSAYWELIYQDATDLSRRIRAASPARPCISCRRSTTRRVGRGSATPAWRNHARRVHSACRESFSATGACRPNAVVHTLFHWRLVRLGPGDDRLLLGKLCPTAH